MAFDPTAKSDPVPFGGPGRIGIVTALKRQAAHVGPIPRHDVDLWRTGSVGDESDPLTIRRPCGRSLIAVPPRQLPGVASVGIHEIDI